jgi:hypothetical protein
MSIESTVSDQSTDLSQPSWTEEQKKKKRQIKQKGNNGIKFKRTVRTPLNSKRPSELGRADEDKEFFKTDATLYLSAYTTHRL